MTTMEKHPRNQVWLSLRGYRVAALKPELSERGRELERALGDGLPAQPDSTRPDFYDVALNGGRAYIHVCRESRTVYLVAYFPSMLNSFLANGASHTNCQFLAAIG